MLAWHVNPLVRLQKPLPGVFGLSYPFLSCFETPLPVSDLFGSGSNFGRNLGLHFSDVEVRLVILRTTGLVSGPIAGTEVRQSPDCLGRSVAPRADPLGVIVQAAAKLAGQVTHVEAWQQRAVSLFAPTRQRGGDQGPAFGQFGPVHETRSDQLAERRFPLHQGDGQHRGFGWP